MKKISFYLILFAFNIPVGVDCQNIPTGDPHKDQFSPPLHIPLLLSGNYGEIRSGHFHTGLDIKTQQVIGKPVYAADSGYVYRVAVESGSYGHVIYLRHPDGSMTVYGHLSRFISPLGEWVKDQQYLKKSFTVDLYPRAEQFVFRQGDSIALSGNTGDSGGPHLHFEIRNHSGTIPYNGLKYRFPIRDTVPPQINWLGIYPVDKSSGVNGLSRKLLLKTTGKGKGITIEGPDPVLYGRIGFGIETFDFLNNSPNICSPYQVSLFMDGQLRLCFILDSIPFSKARYVNSHIDYDEKIRSGKTIQKLFLDPNNQLPIYHDVMNRGIVQFTDSGVHQLLISVFDAYGNESILHCTVRGTATPPVVQPAEGDSDIVARFTYNHTNVFTAPDVKIVIPRDALYTNIDFHFSRQRSDTVPYSNIYRVQNEYTPLNRPYTLSVKTRNLAQKLHTKVYLATVNSHGVQTAYEGVYYEGYVTAKPRVFGLFYVAVDTLPPVIAPESFHPDSVYMNGQVMSFRITDRGTGIQSYEGLIDDHWALFEYDGKNDLLFYRIDGSRLVKGKIHPLEIVVTDKRKNITRYSSTFRY